MDHREGWLLGCYVLPESLTVLVMEILSGPESELEHHCQGKTGEK
jgi:hypothetical protein